MFAHTLCACRAHLAEAAGDHSEAAAHYAEAVVRWRAFGRMPEVAYALLGLARCRPEPCDNGALSEARLLFSSLGYGPALAQTEVA